MENIKLKSIKFELAYFCCFFPFSKQFYGRKYIKHNNVTLLIKLGSIKFLWLSRRLQILNDFITLF